jgi:hypothetical protein
MHIDIHINNQDLNLTQCHENAKKKSSSELVVDNFAILCFGFKVQD